MFDEFGSVTPGIYPSTTFQRDADYELADEFVYGRYANPNGRMVEEFAAQLDGGAHALSFSSGMSAMVAVTETAPTGRRIASQRVMYHGGLEWLRRMDAKRGVSLDMFDGSDLDSLAAVVTEDTDIVWVETPSNPTWDVTDIAGAAEIAHAAGAILVVDSTGAPLVTKPLELGADMVHHSASKYYNGHSDVQCGLLITNAADERWEEIAQLRTSMGTLLAPHEAWLLHRGMQTLELRVRQANANAMAIAQHFFGHPKVEAVLYPGLASHPGHELAKRQMTDGFGGMLSILVKGDGETAKRVATHTSLVVPATSLGGVESLIEHRASVEGPHSLVAPNLLRLSVGIEPVESIIADLEAALAS